MASAQRPEGLDFVERAPLQIRGETTIAAGPAAVWAAIADPAAWLEWFDGMKVARMTSEGPLAVGSSRYVEVPPLKVNEEIIAFDPEARFAFRFLDTNLPLLAAMVEDVTLEPMGSTTRVVYRQCAELKGFAKPLAPVLRRQLQGKVESSLVALDRYVTSRPAPA